MEENEITATVADHPRFWFGFHLLLPDN